jgi:heptosyltransferase-2
MPNPRILIVRPDRIGDVVLSTPLPREIKKQYPESFVAVLLTPYTQDIYVNNPYVDSVIIYDKKKSAFLNALQLRTFKFDYALTLLPTEKLNWILFFSGIRKRIGVGHKFYQFITNSKSVFRNKYIPLRHESDYCLDEIRKLGIEPESLESEILLSEEEKRKGFERKYSWCPNGEKLIGINSTSGNSAPNMVVDEYRKLISLLKKYKVKIAITDFTPPEELKNIDELLYINEGNNLRDSIINLSTLDLLISSSTGPMHMAAGLKIPTLSLFCPLPACSPKLWAPQGNESQFILPSDNYCQDKCPGDPKICKFEGEGGIDAEKVYQQTLNMLALN